MLYRLEKTIIMMRKHFDFLIVQWQHWYFGEHVVITLSNAKTIVVLIFTKIVISKIGKKVRKIIICLLSSCWRLNIHPPFMKRTTDHMKQNGHNTIRTVLSVIASTCNRNSVDVWCGSLRNPRNANVLPIKPNIPIITAIEYRTSPNNASGSVSNDIVIVIILYQYQRKYMHPSKGFKLVWISSIELLIIINLSYQFIYILYCSNCCSVIIMLEVKHPSSVYETNYWPHEAERT